MWTYLPMWFVQDGQVEELAAGSVLRQAGLVARFDSAEPLGPTASLGIAPVSDAGHELPEARRYLYDVTGVCGPARAIRVGYGGEVQRVGSEFELRTGSMLVVARTRTVFEPPAGSVVAGRCSFEVLADYEFEAFDLGDVRADWTVAAVQVEHRALEPREIRAPDGRLRREFTTGSEVGLVDIARMSRWEDERRMPVGSGELRTAATYVLDLQPR